MRSCSLCRAFSLKRKRSTAATWQGRSFESLRTGSVHRGWKSILISKPWPFLLRSRTLCKHRRKSRKHRRKSRKPGLVRQPRHVQCRPRRVQSQSRSSTRRRLQSGRTAREWLPTHHRDPSRSAPPGGRSSYSAFNSAARALQSLVDVGFSWPGARRGSVMQMVVPFPGAETRVILPPSCCVTRLWTM